VECREADLVQGDDKGRIAHGEQLHGLLRLWLDAVHHVDDEDGHVAQRRACGGVVGEAEASSNVSQQNKDKSQPRFRRVSPPDRSGPQRRRADLAIAGS